MRIVARKFASSKTLADDRWALLTAHIDVRLLTLYNKSKAGIELLLSATGRLHATDPRDKIIGILGLAQDVGAGKRFEISPSYKKSVADIYRDVTAGLIGQGRSLYMLAEIKDPLLREVPSLPSWVPNYSVTTCRPAARYSKLVEDSFTCLDVARSLYAGLMVQIIPISVVTRLTVFY